MAYPNPLEIHLASDSDCWVSCVSNAAYTQRVTIKDLQGNVLAVFTGTGEGVQMKTADGADHWGIATRKGIGVTAYYEFSRSGSGGPFNPADVRVNTTVRTSKGTIQTIGTEDAQDSDQNDTWMSVVCTTL